jgi:hypothetical protein
LHGGTKDNGHLAFDRMTASSHSLSSVVLEDNKIVYCATGLEWFVGIGV